MTTQNLLTDFQTLPYAAVRPFTAPVHRLIIPHKGRHLIVPVSDITSLEGEGNYSYLYTKDGKKYLVSRTLKSFAQILDSDTFIRIHKSSIINVNYLVEICVDPDRYVKLKCGREVAISRRKMHEVYHNISLR
jgi:two-component system, LytTR family, response regulator